MAAGVLEQTRQARASVAALDRDSAIRHVEQALMLARGIQESAPAGAGPLLVPFYSERETVRTYRPAHGKRDSSLRQVEREVTDLSLDVTTARSRLESARAALNTGDLKQADADLASVEKAVVRRTSVAENVPLVQVRDNLTLARARLLNGKYNDAKPPLRAAAQALTGVGDTPEISRMRDEITSLADHVKSERANAVPRIDRWLEALNRMGP